MATKKELTIEELQAQYEAIGAEIQARKKAEAEEKAAKLAVEKDARYAEIQKVEKHLIELKSAYRKDYGNYNAVRTCHNENVLSLWDIFFDEV